MFVCGGEPSTLVRVCEDVTGVHAYRSFMFFVFIAYKFVYRAMYKIPIHMQDLLRFFFIE